MRCHSVHSEWASLYHPKPELTRRSSCFQAGWSWVAGMQSAPKWRSLMFWHQSTTAPRVPGLSCYMMATISCNAEPGGKNRASLLSCESHFLAPPTDKVSLHSHYVLRCRLGRNNFLPRTTNHQNDQHNAPTLRCCAPDQWDCGLQWIERRRINWCSTTLWCHRVQRHDGCRVPGDCHRAAGPVLSWGFPEKVRGNASPGTLTCTEQA